MECNILSADASASESSSSEEEESVSCVKIPLPKHIIAYVNKVELVCDTEPINCDSNLVEKVINNYIIVKRILSSLAWQDKMICKNVSTTWHSAVQALQKEQLSPADFVVDMQLSRIRNGVKYKLSGNLYTEPLVIFTFANTAGFTVSNKCMILVPHPCDPACEKEHCLIDFLQHNVSSPKDCMLTVRASYLTYKPLIRSLTYEHTIRNRMFRRTYPFYGGVYVPKIPDVEFHLLNIKTNTDLQKDFYDVVSKLAKDRIIKGVVIYVTEKFLLHSLVEECSYFNYFKEVQPDIPYALGGCIVEDTFFEQSDTDHIIESLNDNESNYFVSENLITFGMFTVPKTINNTEQNEKHNFDMYSLIIESPDWSKPKIKTTINEFSKKVPRFEHSIVLKLSCVGRDQKHEAEEDYFRTEFPDTRMIGCFGNGELGMNHPERSQAEAPPMKRNRKVCPPTLGLLYSYSTVFVYLGWGKITSPQGPV